MTRREMQTRVLNAQFSLDVASNRLSSRMQLWKRHVNLPALLIGSFATGAAVSFLPIHRVTRTLAPFATVGFQTLRTFVWPMIFGALKNNPSAADTSVSTAAG